MPNLSRVALTPFSSASLRMRVFSSLVNVLFFTSIKLQIFIYNFVRLIKGPVHTFDFLKRKENIILTGASGVGKSYLAQALGHHACLLGYKTIYSNTSRLLKKFKLSKMHGTYLKELKKLVKADLLILDDFGLQAFDNHARETLMDIVDDRYSAGSIILSSQIPVSAWYDIIGEGTIADAILDRIVNSSHRIDLRGESLRKGVLKTE